MGLDASVMCTCYQDGRALPPPCDPSLLVFDDGWLELDVPFDDNVELHTGFDRWLAEGCEHPRMEVASVRVSNWSGYRAFQQALERAGGRARFPTLYAELPEVNGGTTDAGAAAQALAELATFRAQPDVGHSWFLVSTDTGETMYEYIAAYDGKFILDGRTGMDIGVDPRGLFVVERGDEGRELFRARRVAQRWSDEGVSQAGAVELTNLDTGERFRCATLIGRVVAARSKGEKALEEEPTPAYPERMHVEQRAIVPTQFAYAVSALEQVFGAAVATGNPVRWC
jgi:hypothetical protein